MNSIEPLDLARYSGAQIEIENLLASRRPVISVTCGDDVQKFVLTTNAQTPAGQILFQCQTGQEEVGVSVSADWLRQFYPEEAADIPLEQLPGPLAMAAAQVVLQPLLAAASTVFPHPLTVTGIGAEHSPDWRMVFLKPDPGNGHAPPAAFCLSPEAVRSLVGVLHDRPVDSDRSLGTAVAVSLHVGLGSQFIRQDELAALRPGTIVLVPQVSEPRHAPLFLGPNFTPFGFATIEDSVLTLETLGEVAMTSDTVDEQAPMETDVDHAVDADAEQPVGSGQSADLETQEAVEVNIEDLEIRLDFILGKKTMTLAELRELAPGSTVTLDMPTTHTVGIYSSGRRLGDGEMVEIDGNLGVRITRTNRRADG